MAVISLLWFALITFDERQEVINTFNMADHGSNPHRYTVSKKPELHSKTEENRNGDDKDPNSKVNAEINDQQNPENLPGDDNSQLKNLSATSARLQRPSSGKERRHVVLVKVHKAGSSTLHNI